MSIGFLIFVSFIAFAFLTFVRKWHDYALLFTVAIGFAVNANIYNSVTTPVMLGNIVFAIDSILYTGFMFTVLIVAKEYGVRKAKIMTSSTIAAILVSAFIEFFAKFSSFGYSQPIFNSLCSYIFSSLGTFLGVWIMLVIFEALEKRGTNTYINFINCVIVASLINSLCYYGLSAVVTGTQIDNFIYMLIGSYIGKFFSIILGLISYFINTHFWIPNDLKYKYPTKKVANQNNMQNIMIQDTNQNENATQTNNSTT